MTTLTALTASEFMQQARPTKTGEVVWDTQGEEPELQILNGIINVVSSRRVNSNVKLGVRMALELAARAQCDLTGHYQKASTGEDVFIHDTPIITEPHELSEAEREMPRRLNPYLHARVRGVMYLNTYATNGTIMDHIEYYVRRSEAFTRRREVAGPKGDPMSGLPCQFLSAATGTWAEKLELIEYNCQKNGVDTLILNSFEFAGFTPMERNRVVRDLVTLRNTYELTIIVFTTDTRKGMAAGIAVRGPMGSLVGASDNFWVLFEESGGEYSRKSIRSADPKRADYERPKYSYEYFVDSEPTEAEKKRARNLELLAKAENTTLEDVMLDSPFTFAPARIEMLKREGLWAE